jgi:hypothetical protein
MSITTPDFAALLAEARIAALRALTDILATSKDPQEIRRAAIAILRTPDPKPSATPRTGHRRAEAPPPRQPSDTPAKDDPTPPPSWTLPGAHVPSIEPGAIAATIDPVLDLENDLEDLLNIDLPQLSPLLRQTRRRRASARQLSVAAGAGPPS